MHPSTKKAHRIDLVLLVEALTPEFGQVFWDFVKEGGYENRQKSSGKPQFYRVLQAGEPGLPRHRSRSTHSSKVMVSRLRLVCR